LAALVAITAALVLLTGCPAVEPYAHVDTVGYEVGLRGSWAGVESAAASMIPGANVSTGKEVVR